MIGRKVKSGWHKIEGEVIRWEPLGAGMCDVLVREPSGREGWYSSSDLAPADGRGPLPSRAVARRAADAAALAQLRAIRAQHVADFGRPWPGSEHGKVLIGRAVDGAIDAIEGRR